MSKNLLEKYFGRGVIIGKTNLGVDFGAYFVTGRSPSSQARILELDESDFLVTKPTDQKVLETGDSSLLIYPAMVHTGGIFAISNGAHTKDVLNGYYRGESFADAMAMWFYEPDAPNWTPRISGIIDVEKGVHQFGIIRRLEDGVASYEIENNKTSLPGTAAMLTTYTGVNVNPLPSSNNIPLFIEDLQSNTIDGLLQELEPRMGNPEFRVGLAVALHNTKTGKFDIGIQNYRG